MVPQTSFGGFYASKRVFVTGHTGFKGSWLSLWLHRLGATVHGYATDPPTEPSLFESAHVSSALASDTRADLADLERLKMAVNTAEPEIVFHLAAQPLVLASYRNPLGTFATNIMGTANLLEAVRPVRTVRAVILVTTDKVYKNDNSGHAYREIDQLGGHDPYSASKAGAEIVAASYRASFFTGKDSQSAQVATVRAGNVVGGGDWASDRLLPDCARAFAKGERVLLRSAGSVRPWQHVFEPLSGYLQLAQRLCGPNGSEFAKSWNFGPDGSGDATVAEVAEITARLWGEGAQPECADGPQSVHEAASLRLDSTLARSELGWKPRWSLHEALAQTVAWYRASARGADLAIVSLDQIRAYEAAG
jgi:CDP-glucose 4,6-dehydratase